MPRTLPLRLGPRCLDHAPHLAGERRVKRKNHSVIHLKDAQNSRVLQQRELVGQIPILWIGCVGLGHCILEAHMYVLPNECGRAEVSQVTQSNISSRSILIQWTPAAQPIDTV